MLRRGPTTISLTAVDIERYQANRERRMQEQQEQAQAAAQADHAHERDAQKGTSDSMEDVTTEADETETGDGAGGKRTKKGTKKSIPKKRNQASIS
ncbi:hypothetical protein M011DRAFT_474163 [Sporormia fimetaria CBS 119925]|uniref:Anaphase-promoting complex, subunit CDC26 n=1 Tax=Sporormia fimetaria CBS 119925 TaxID=1340428 RepID=A0A6A6VM70_9PLEO|nr:hypothetical protein M011DRAFT_474163 [Sporormia fimetaria CBS 119925]